MRLTKEVLADYTQREHEIKRLEEKIDYWSHFTPKSEHGVVMSSMRDYPFALTHIVLSGSDIKSDEEQQNKLKNLMITLQSRQKEFLALEIDVALAIEEISDPEMRVIIESKFVQGMSDKEIAEQLGYERSSVAKKIAKFFEEQELSHISH